MNRNRKTIVFMCFLLIFIYGITLFSAYMMMSKVFGKDEYFFKHLPLEKQRLRKYQEDLKHLSTHVMPRYDRNNIVCVQCDLTLSELDLRYIRRLIENNQHIKQEYYEVLQPCQHFFVLLCLFNTISMVTIFKEPSKLFFVSNFFCIMCLWIRGEILVDDQWVLRASLFLGLCIVLFSLYLVFIMIRTLIFVLKYQKMPHTPINH